jgi:hypothetical protein
MYIRAKLNMNNVPDNEDPAAVYIIPVVSEQEASNNSTHINNLCLILNVQMKLTGKVLQIFNLRGEITIMMKHYNRAKPSAHYYS